jgi:Mrp family chromosome partitioning ATPase
MRTYTFENIPLSLQQINRWVVWRNDNGAKVPINPRTGWPGNVFDKSNQYSFADACDAVRHYSQGTDPNPNGYGIGLVFDGSDGLVFIDFDNKSYDAELDALFAEDIKAFDTYTERSPSEKGYHLIALGSRPDGIVLPRGVEIYDRDRFATFTGWTINGHEIRHAQHLLDKLPRKGSAGAPNIGDTGGATTALDALAAARALAAECGNVVNCAPGTFNNTLNNAAFALGTFVGAGTLDADRVTEALYAAALQARPGKGEESRKTIASGLRSGIARPRASLIEDRPQISLAIPAVDALQTARMTPEQASVPIPVVEATASLDSLLGGHVFRNLPGPDVPFEIRPLPGLLGEIEAYLMAQSSLPYAVAAHVGALVWMAGVTGLTYGVKSNGQNLYMILTAPTSTGKSATLNGLATLNNMIENGHPDETSAIMSFAAMRGFVLPGQATSVQAILRVLQKSFSGYMYIDEVDRNLRAMLSGRATELEDGKKQLLMTLFDGARQHARIDGMQYAKAENTIEGLGPRALTYFGLTTPDKLYELVGQDEVHSGFLNRFVLLNGAGGGALNHDPAPIPPIGLVQYARGCAAFCAASNQKGQRVEVKLTDAADALQRAIADEALDLQRALGEAYGGLLGRAAQHAARLASVIATSENHGSPVVTVETLRYTIGLVMDGIWAVLRKFARGETGVVAGNQLKQEALIWDFIRDAFKASPDLLHSYKLNPTLIAAKTVTRRYVFIRASQCAAFKGDPFKVDGALDRCAANMVANGELEIVQGRTKQNVLYKVIAKVT